MDEFHIRAATLEDLPHILRHRRAMFRDMRSGTDSELDEVVATAEAFLRRAMPVAEYRGWLASVPRKIRRSSRQLIEQSPAMRQ